MKEKMYKFDHSDQTRECLKGSPTGESVLFARINNGGIAASHDINELAGHVNEPDPFSISSIIQYGFLAFPRSIYKNIYALGIGWRLDLERAITGDIVSIESDFPYFSSDSSGQSIPSEKTLLDLLVKSIRSKVGSGPAALMLSSGKDSVSLALAAAEAGLRSVRSITFSNRSENEESLHAAIFAGKLGIPHETVAIDYEGGSMRLALERFFSKASQPCVDFAQIPYIVAAQTMDAGEKLIDGGGNDVYAGFVPTKSYLMKERFSKLGLHRMTFLRDNLNPESKFLEILKSRMEICFRGFFLPFRNFKKFYPEGVDIREYWAAESGKHGSRDLFDLCALAGGTHMVQNAHMLKAQVAAESAGTTAVFPWCDADLIDYYFNLPEPSRFSRAQLTNKILIRKMLGQYMDYDFDRLPKRGFEFDLPLFVNNHSGFVRETILDCNLWSRGMEDVLTGLFKCAETRQKYFEPIVHLFLLSGWLNHRRIRGHSR